MCLVALESIVFVRRRGVRQYNYLVYVHYHQKNYITSVYMSQYDCRKQVKLEGNISYYAHGLQKDGA